MSRENYRDRQEFDINASIYILRNNREPLWLREEILSNELSYIEEGINARQQRPYNLYFDGIDLYNGDGQSMTDLVKNGEQWAASNITRRKAIADQKENEYLKQLMSGEFDSDTLVTFRPFPIESSTKTNRNQLISLGFQPDRQLGFMSIYTRVDEKTLFVECVSLDGTEPSTIRQLATEHGQFIPSEILTDEFHAYPLQFESSKLNVKADLVNLYDELMRAKTGIDHIQGRPLTECNKQQIEIGQFLKKQPDLIEWYWQALVALSKTNIEGDHLTARKKDLTYSFWARVKERYTQPEEFNKTGRENMKIDINEPAVFQRLYHEVMAAGVRASERFEVLIGCGGAMAKSAESLFDMSPKDALDFILGSEEDNKIPKKLRCINQNCRKVSDKSQVVKKDCWVCPHCGIKSVCGRLIFPKTNEPSKKDIFETKPINNDKTISKVGNTALK